MNNKGALDWGGCVRAGLQLICNSDFLSVTDFSSNPKRIFAAHELTGLVDGSTATKMTVQVPSIERDIRGYIYIHTHTFTDTAALSAGRLHPPHDTTRHDNSSTSSAGLS